MEQIVAVPLGDILTVNRGVVHGQPAPFVADTVSSADGVVSKTRGNSEDFDGNGIGSGGILVEPGDHEAIMEIVRDLTPQRLEQLRRNIQQECRVVLWEDFLNENDKLYSDSL